MNQQQSRFNLIGMQGWGTGIQNCFIGPYSSIAEDTTLIEIDIEHSVILKGATLEGISSRIVDSLIGERAHLKVAPQRPKALRFMIGDDSKIELS